MEHPEAVGVARTPAGRRWTRHCVASAVLCLAVAALSLGRSHYYNVTIEQFNLLWAIVTFAVLAGLFLNYTILVLAPDEEGGRALSARTVLRVAVPMAVVLAVAPPLLSLDSTAYVLGARNLVHDGLSPYVTPLNAVADNPWLGEIGHGTRWIGGALTYGPLFYWVCAPWVLLPEHSIFVAIYLWKGFLLALFVISIPLFDRLARGMGLTSRATALYALNPALLVHTMLDGHNDFLMAFAATMALYMAVNARWARGALWIGLATATKYYSVVLLPLVAFRERRFRPLHAVAAGAIVVGVVVAAAAPLGFPFREMFGTLQGFGGAGPLYYPVPTIDVFDMVFGPYSQTALRIATVVSYGVIVYLTLYRRDRPVEFAFWSVTAFLFLTVRHFGPWYPVAAVPAGALLAHSSGKYGVVVVMLTAYSLFHLFGI